MHKHNAPEQRFEAYLEQAERTPFSGWNFEYITKTHRMIEAPRDWNYHTVIQSYMHNAETMLDMGTGGGEALAQLTPLPLHTFATEQYPPNVIIAREKLEPLGVKVIEIDGAKYPDNEILPFDDGYFNLVINRHESYNVEELSRIIKNKGIFISQQVGDRNLENLVEFLKGHCEIPSEWNLDYATRQLETAGFKILLKRENVSFYRFYDIGAIAYFLKAIPWIIGDFTINGYKDRLWKLHMDICHNGFYDATMHRFMIVAQKSASGHATPPVNR